MKKSPEQLLKQYWNHDCFRPLQKEIIDAILDGEDVVTLLPTGGGKSICFQIPGLMLEGVCIVITPLVALMEDQVQRLTEKKISSYSVHSGLYARDIDIIYDNCIYGHVKFLYIAPERIHKEIFIERFRKMNVSFLAVDEAHCISEWGHDFRPSYLKIGRLRELKPNMPVMALTATATPETSRDIVKQLKMSQPQFFKKSFVRHNLSLVVRETEDKMKQLHHILQNIAGHVIIYVRSRRRVEDISKTITRHHISSIFYHAGLSYEERMRRQRLWLEGKVRVIVATNAFGMGIDKDDVRAVIHMDVPDTLEAYYQEVGRGGRDGKRAYAVMIYHTSDAEMLKKKMAWQHPSIERLRKIYQGLGNYYQLAVGSISGEAFDFDIYKFCDRYNWSVSLVFNALKRLEEHEYIHFNEAYYRPSQVHLLIDKKALYAFQVEHEQFDLVLKAMLRLYGAILFTYHVAIFESHIAQIAEQPETIVRQTLKSLNNQQIIDYIPSSGSPQIIWNTERKDIQNLYFDKEKIERLHNRALKKAKAIVTYVVNAGTCRMQLIQDYFDEQRGDCCGICDTCIAKRRNTCRKALAKKYKDEIRRHLSIKSMKAEELQKNVTKGKPSTIFIETVREMLENKEVQYDKQWVLHNVQKIKRI